MNPNQVDPSARGTTVIAADGETRGHLTGGSRDCDLESCGGKRLATRWDNGKLTYPCTKGMEWQDNAWRIL